MEISFSELIPRVSTLSQKFDNTSLLFNNHWVLVNETNSKNKLYIFRDNNELIISEDGKVDVALWRYLGKNTLLIENEKEKNLYKHEFFDQNLIAIKIRDDQNYSFFVNEEKFDQGLNSENEILKYLHNKYLINNTHKKITRRKRKSLSNTKNTGFYNYNFRYNYNYNYNALDKINNKIVVLKNLKKLNSLEGLGFYIFVLASFLPITFFIIYFKTEVNIFLLGFLIILVLSLKKIIENGNLLFYFLTNLLISYTIVKFLNFKSETLIDFYIIGLNLVLILLLNNIFIKYIKSEQTFLLTNVIITFFICVLAVVIKEQVLFFVNLCVLIPSICFLFHKKLNKNKKHEILITQSGQLAIGFFLISSVIYLLKLFLYI